MASMKTIHRTTISAQCPHGHADLYDVEFHTACLVLVESLQKAIDESVGTPAYQEELTIKLAEKSGCHVVTRGRHLKFETECTADP